MQTLHNRVTFYVPDQRNTPDVIATKLSGRFGGATQLPAKGSWVGLDGSLITEPIVLVYAYGDFQEHDRRYFSTLAAEIRQDLAQESVAYEVDGCMYLI